LKKPYQNFNDVIQEGMSQFSLFFRVARAFYEKTYIVLRVPK